MSAFVQASTVNAALSASFTSPSNNGDLVAFGITVYMAYPAAAPSITIADNSSGNVWIQAGPPAVFNYGPGTYNIYQFVFYCLGIKAPAGNLTVTATVPGEILTICGMTEYSLVVGTIVDPTSYAKNSDTNSVGMPVTTSLSGTAELLLFFEFCLGTLGSPISGWNLRAVNLMGMLDNLSGPSSGSQTINPISQTGNNYWEAVLLGFYVPAPPTPPSPPNPIPTPPTNEGQPTSMQLRTCLDILHSINPTANLKDWNNNTFSLVSIQRALTSWSSDSAKAGVAQNPPVTFYGKLIDAYVQYFPKAGQIWMVYQGSLVQLLYTVILV